MNKNVSSNSANGVLGRGGTALYQQYQRDQRLKTPAPAATAVGDTSTPAPAVTAVSATSTPAEIDAARRQSKRFLAPRIASSILSARGASGLL